MEHEDDDRRGVELSKAPPCAHAARRSESRLATPRTPLSAVPSCMAQTTALRLPRENRCRATNHSVKSCFGPWKKALSTKEWRSASPIRQIINIIQIRDRAICTIGWLSV